MKPACVQMTTSKDTSFLNISVGAHFVTSVYRTQNNGKKILHCVCCLTKTKTFDSDSRVQSLDYSTAVCNCSTRPPPRTEKHSSFCLTVSVCSDRTTSTSTVYVQRSVNGFFSPSLGHSAVRVLL